MDHPFITFGAALALGGALLASPAYAVFPTFLINAPSLIIPIQDEENEEVWRDLRPDITPPEAAVGKEGREGGSGIEEKELKEDGVIPE